jgi:hypothetical protein
MSREGPPSDASRPGRVPWIGCALTALATAVELRIFSSRLFLRNFRSKTSSETPHTRDDLDCLGRLSRSLKIS